MVVEEHGEDAIHNGVVGPPQSHIQPEYAQNESIECLVYLALDKGPNRFPSGTFALLSRWSIRWSLLGVGRRRRRQNSPCKDIHALFGAEYLAI